MEANPAVILGIATKPSAQKAVNVQKEVTAQSFEKSPTEHSGHYSCVNHTVSEWSLGVQTTIRALILCDLTANGHQYSLH